MKIAIIDRDENFATFLHKLIKEIVPGSNVEILKPGPEIFEKLKNTEFEYIFINTNFKKIDVFYILEKLQECRNKPKIIVIAEFLDSNTKKKILEIKTIEYLIKPITKKEIEALFYQKNGETENEWEGVALIDVLQFLSYQKGVWKIEIFKNGMVEGFIILKDGVIKSGRLGNDKGIEAIYKILNKKELRHKIKKIKEIEIERNEEEVNQPAEFVILNYIKSIEESNANKYNENKIKFFLEKMNKELKEVKGYIIFKENDKEVISNLNLTHYAFLKNLINNLNQLLKEISNNSFNLLLCEFKKGKIGAINFYNEVIFFVFTSDSLHIGFLKFILEDIKKQFLKYFKKVIKHI